MLLFGFSYVNKTARMLMTDSELRTLLEHVADGATDAATAHRQLLEVLRARPYEDLGFARVDHHRAVRQGFPEVILGLGKTPAQVAAIAAEIVERGSTLLVTRATEAAYDAVRVRVPGATYHADAAIITFRQQDVSAGKGTIVVAAAGTSDLFVAEEAARTAELMGNDVVRLYDVGVAGLQRLLGERPRLAAARVIIVVAGMEGALPSVVSGLVSVPVIAASSATGRSAVPAAAMAMVPLPGSTSCWRSVMIDATA